MFNFKLDKFIEEMQKKIDELEKRFEELEKDVNEIQPNTKTAAVLVETGFKKTKTGEPAFEMEYRSMFDDGGFKRDRIVKGAINDVDYLTDDYKIPYHRVKFFVNKKKRTIAAVIEPCNLKDKTIRRGIAKCDPNDCFNTHIGKAIALRRAIGIGVPEDYLNAPQPTEVHPGDVVEFPSGGTRVVSQIDGSYMKYTNGMVNSLSCITTGTIKIIDDSHDDI